MRRPDVKGSWAGLTPRGTSFLTAGAVALGCALVLQQTDLVRVAALLTTLPLVAVLWMALTRLEIGVRRTAEPPRGTVSTPVQLRVRLANNGRGRTPTLLFEDHVPPGLEAETRIVVPPLRRGEAARLSYSVVPRRRGRYALGPARIVSIEPFGLVERSWQARASDTLLVRPEIHQLPAVLPNRRIGSEGDADLSGSGAAGDPDLTVREYRRGDDLRRVHWPTTARRGELMVRPDQHPQDLRAVVVLDTRAAAHRGSALTGSLEWAVQAAASAVVHVADRGHAVALLGDLEPTAGDALPEPIGDEHTRSETEDLLDRLAVVRPASGDVLEQAAEELARTSASLVVAVLGEVGPDDVASLAVACHEAVRVALVCDSTSYERLPEQRRALVAQRQAEAVAELREHGWRVVEAPRGSGVPTAWAALAEQEAVR